MKRFISLALLLALIVFTSCSDFGKKVTFTDHKGEVYYKGDGVTEADAKATGKFLEEAEFFIHDDKTRSVQISKKDGRVQFRMVVDEKGLAGIKNADERFAEMAAQMSKEVYSNQPVDLIYTDDKFSDKKTLPYNPALLEMAKVTDEAKSMKKMNYEKNTLFYATDISEEAAKNVLDYLVKSEFFMANGNNDLLLKKGENNGAYFRFPVKPEFTTTSGLKKISDYATQMKSELFPDVPLEFEVLDENMKSVKTFSYPGTNGGSH